VICVVISKMLTYFTGSDPSIVHEQRDVHPWKTASEACASRPGGCRCGKQANPFAVSPQSHRPGRAKPGPHTAWLPILKILQILLILSKTPINSTSSIQHSFAADPASAGTIPHRLGPWRDKTRLSITPAGRHPRLKNRKNQEFVD
jgi:hypothetical protein